jgi:hypothetical protein
MTPFGWAVLILWLLSGVAAATTHFEAEELDKDRLVHCLMGALCGPAFWLPATEAIHAVRARKAPRELEMTGKQEENTHFKTRSEKNNPKQPRQPIFVDQHGVRRFRPNKVVRYLLDNGDIDLNQLAQVPFDDEDRCQFAQLIGYSVDGYCDLPYTQGDDLDALDPGTGSSE